MQGIQKRMIRYRVPPDQNESTIRVSRKMMQRAGRGRYGCQNKAAGVVPPTASVLIQAGR